MTPAERVTPRRLCHGCGRADDIPRHGGAVQNRGACGHVTLHEMTPSELRVDEPVVFLPEGSFQPGIRGHFN